MLVAVSRTRVEIPKLADAETLGNNRNEIATPRRAVDRALARRARHTRTVACFTSRRD